MTSMHRTVLVVAAHPDDEVLGCGGTLAKLAAQGTGVYVSFMSDGVTSRPADPAVHAGQLEARKAAAARASAILGVKNLTFGEFPDNRMDSVALLDITRSIEVLIDRIKPDTVFTHFPGDLNIDHRRVHEAVVTACRPQTGHPVRTLLSFEVPSSTEWQVAGMAPAFFPQLVRGHHRHARAEARRIGCLRGRAAGLAASPLARGGAASRTMARGDGRRAGR